MAVVHLLCPKIETSDMVTSATTSSEFQNPLGGFTVTGDLMASFLISSFRSTEAFFIKDSKVIEEKLKNAQRCAFT